ncbi:hypothetical protein ACG3SL_05325 [Sphingomonas sp. CJ20]
MLNIARLPGSVSNIDCESFGFTDVLERCAFTVSPSDFHVLLGGYRFVEAVACPAAGPAGRPCLGARAHTQTSHTYCCGPKVGPDFVVAHTFIASPKAFENGGTVTILTDSARTNAMVDLYIE